jgi:hypothetical protein
MRVRKEILAVFAAGMACASLAAGADDLVLIANKDSGVERMTQEDAVNIFMSRYKKLPSGITALPVDESGEKASFYRALVGKDLSEIQSYRARLVFSGQGSPPHEVDTAPEALDAVANNRGAIAYIDRAKVNARVKIVLVLPRNGGAR